MRRRPLPHRPEVLATNLARGLKFVLRSFFPFTFFIILPCCAGCIWIFMYGGVSVESGVSFFRSVLYEKKFLEVGSLLRIGSSELLF